MFIEYVEQSLAAGAGAKIGRAFDSTPFGKILTQRARRSIGIA